MSDDLTIDDSCNVEHKVASPLWQCGERFVLCSSSVCNEY